MKVLLAKEPVLRIEADKVELRFSKRNAPFYIDRGAAGGMQVKLRGPAATMAAACLNANQPIKVNGASYRLIDCVLDRYYEMSTFRIKPISGTSPSKRRPSPRSDRTRKTAGRSRSGKSARAGVKRS